MIAQSRPSGADAHPRDVVADGPDLPALEALGRDQHREVRLAARARERRRDVGRLALGALDAEDQHVLGEPALAAGRGSCRCAARGTSCRAARCRRSREPTDQIVLSCGKWQMKRRSGLHSSIECRPRLKSFESPSMSSATLPHARHDPHVEHDVDAVGELDADLRQRRARAAP